MIEEQVQIVIAHYGVNRRITEAECLSALPTGSQKNIFVDFGVGYAALEDLYDLAFENIALAQRRQFTETLKPLLEKYPSATIAYFGFIPIPVGLHLGYLVGNTHPYTIYQLHHQSNKWFADHATPKIGYTFELKPTALPIEKQRGKGEVVIRIGTSFAIDQQSTAEVVPTPANEFDIAVVTPDVDALFSQGNIQAVVNAFQEVLNSYANLLTDREKIHLFV
ncbi:MAG TPA: SAVED domain-containing protein, partial [Chryseolinea sp.]